MSTAVTIVSNVLKQGGTPITDADEVSAVGPAMRAALALPPTIFCDASAANDSADGLTPATPKQTIAAALALCVAGGTLRLARGRRWYEDLNFTVSNLTIRPYGAGVRPLLDGSRAISAGAWTAHATIANVWQCTLTLPAATIYSPPSNQWGIMLWDEVGSKRGIDAALTYYTAGADIAANITYVGSNPGTFTAHKVGSTTKDARQTVGTQFTFYARFSDSFDPSAGARAINYVDMSQHFVLGEGSVIEDLVFQRAGNKDMIGISYATSNQPGIMRRCDLLEASAHAIVGGGMDYEDCFAKGGVYSMVYSGAGLHNYRDTLNKGTSRGCFFRRCRVDGFYTGYYTHGSDSGTQHNSFDLRDCEAVNCSIGLSAGLNSAAKTPIIDGFVLKNCATGLDLGSGANLRRIRYTGTITGNCAFITSNGAGGVVDLEDCSVVFRSAGNCNAFQNTHASTQLVVTANRIAVWRASAASLSGAQKNIKITLTNSIYAAISDATLPWTGVVTAGNTFLQLGKSTLDTLRVANPGIDSTCIAPWVTQVYSRTILDADLSATVGTRAATYVSGSTLSVSYVATGSPPRAIRVIDAYGAGLHYDGIVTSSSPTPTNTVQVSPNPASAFSGKAYKWRMTNALIWPATVDICSVSKDGLQLATSNIARYAVGQYLTVGGVRGRASFGVRKITAISGSILTLDRACSWTVDPSFSYIPITGGSGIPLPTVAVTFDQSFARGSVAGTITKGEGGTISIAEDIATGSFNFDYEGTKFNTAGTSQYYGQIRSDEGYIDAGISLFPGDTLAVSANVYIAALDLTFPVPPALSGVLTPATGSEPARLLMGPQNLP